MGFCWHCGGDASEPDHRAHCDGRQGAVEAASHNNGIVISAECDHKFIDSTVCLKCGWQPPSLEEFDPHEHVRTTDPDTSHAAAWSVHDATQVQLRVVAIFERHPEGLTDEDLVTIYQREWPCRALESRASARKRRSDLAKMGVLYDSGERRVLTTGRRGIVWKLATKPVEVA